MQAISGDVWQNRDVKDAMREADIRRYCIAYVTRLPRGMFRRGDVLICDASRMAVSSGETDPGVLMRLIGRGVKVYSHKALHAKCAVFNDVVLTGSANLSESSADRMCELSVLQKSKPLAAQLIQFMDELVSDGVTVSLRRDDLIDLKKVWRSACKPWQNALRRRRKPHLESPKGTHKGQFFLVESIVPEVRSPTDMTEEENERNMKDSKVFMKKHQGFVRGAWEIDYFHMTDMDAPQRYKIGDRIVTIEYNTRKTNSRALVYGGGVVVKVVRAARHYYIYYARPKEGVPYGKVKNDYGVINALKPLGRSVYRKVTEEEFEVLEKAVRRIGRHMRRRK